MEADARLGPTLASLFSLEGKVALVTGGSRGIGRALADGLAGAGARVAVVDVARNEAACPHPMFAADISRPDDVEGAVEAVFDSVGPIDILVNNAGINRIHRAEDFPNDEWERVLSINLTGAFLCARIVGRSMIARGSGGRIINIASVLGHVGPSMHTAVAYSAAKAGLLGITRALAVEWARHRILVNAICPGMIATELTASRLQDGNYTEAILARVPLKEVGAPLDLVGAAIYLASPAARLVTGHSLNVDGGWLAA